MGNQLKVFIVNMLFATLVALSFSLYAMTFRRVQNAGLGTFQEIVSFAVRVLFDPYFIAGLALALGGSVLRIVLMRWLGIGRTALVSEISLVMMIVFSYFFFDSKIRFPQDYLGAALIMLGSYVVSR